LKIIKLLKIHIFGYTFFAGGDVLKKMKKQKRNNSISLNLGFQHNNPNFKFAKLRRNFA